MDEAKVEEEKKSYGYGKRPLWQWIAIYVVIGAIIYGLVYYFVIAKKGGYSYNNNSQAVPTSSSPVSANTVKISNYSFNPATLTVKGGDTVTWTNEDGVNHNVVADDKSFDTGVIEPGKTGSVTFSKAGTFAYHCSIHPTMKATIVVQ